MTGKFRLFSRSDDIFYFVWLVNIGFPFYFLTHLPLRESWYGFILLAVLVFAYVLTYRQRKHMILYISVQVSAVLLLSLIYHPNNLMLSFYPVSTCGLLLRIPTIISFLVVMLGGGMFIIRHHHGSFFGGEPIMVLLPAVTMVVLPFVIRMITQYDQVRTQLHLANEEIKRLIKSEERERIARDLHDTLGHTLSAVTLKSELAEKLIPHEPDRAVGEIRDIHQMTRAALRQVRTLVSGMYAVKLEEELKQGTRLLDVAEITLDTQGIPPHTGALPSLAENVLGMCLREALTNVARHSQATHCKVDLKEQDHDLILTVQDNGMGITGSWGHGLTGMKERLKLVDGKLKIRSYPGRGTQIHLVVPKTAQQSQKEHLV